MIGNRRSLRRVRSNDWVVQANVALALAEKE
jgi:hypothetical protein